MLLEFDYVNWRGDDHHYVIEPEGLTWEEYPGDVSPEGWFVHGMVVTRDGDPRKDMGPARRRSFRLVKMKNLMEVERSG